MIRNVFVYAALGLFIAYGPALGRNMTDDYSNPGDHTVSTRLETWHDTARNRDLPVKLYLPSGEGPHPVVVFSHGLGGSREAAPYLGQHWASWGFIGVFVQHPGSDASIWAGATNRDEAMAQVRAGLNRDAAIARFSDIPFIVDEIERRAAAGELAADPGRLGMAGHSFGAGTTLAAMGRGRPRGVSFSEPRFAAGLALSPSPPSARIPARMQSRMFAAMDRPIMHLTGTEDRSEIQPDLDPADRTIPFQLIPEGAQYLVVFEGGDHAVFGGRPNRRRPEQDWYPEVQAITAEISTAMWMAYLNTDQAAIDWLNGSGFEAAIRAGDQVERRNIE
jgi:dienelactone hydrolase